MTSNRFSDLIGGLNQPEPAKASASTQAKSKSKDYTRCTLYLTKGLHKRLKMAATDLELEMSDIAEQALDAWLSEHSDV